jgi:hypothetical protein
MQRTERLERLVAPLLDLLALLLEPLALALGLLLGDKTRRLLAPPQLGSGARNEPWAGIAVWDTCTTTLITGQSARAKRRWVANCRERGLRTGGTV